MLFLFCAFFEKRLALQKKERGGGNDFSKQIKSSLFLRIGIEPVMIDIKEAEWTLFYIAQTYAL